MKINGTNIIAKSRPQQNYVVEFAFINDFDENQDIDSTDSINLLFSIEVKAVSNITAINAAYEILMTEKALSFYGFSKENAEHITENHSEVDIKDYLKDFMLDNPTSVQCYVKGNKNELFRLTEQSIYQYREQVNENMINDIETYLEEQGE